MPSAVSKGQHYLTRTMTWLRGQGYVCLRLQAMGWAKTASGFRAFKRDHFGADVLAVSSRKILFVQVKGGEKPSLSTARAAFAAYPLAPYSEQWICWWPVQAREPEIEVCAVGPQAGGRVVIHPPRKKPKLLPLFARAR